MQIFFLLVISFTLLATLNSIIMGVIYWILFKLFIEYYLINFDLQNSMQTSVEMKCLTTYS